MATEPTLAGFIAFIRNVMGISTTVLPDSAPVIPMAYEVAKAVVNPALALVGIGTPPFTSIFALAVYNLAGDNLINYATDQPGQTYFAAARTNFNSNGFVSGIISSASDEGTSETLVVMEAAKNFTLSNLQNLKTPWGRQYLAFAQDYGQLFGMT